MAYFDMDEEALRRYKPERHEPTDFDDFWQNTLAEARQYPLAAHFEPVDFGLAVLETFDLTFNGYGGQPIKGWLIMPRHRSATRLPCIVEYIGYNGGRGQVTQWLHFAAAGYAHLVMDTRGQGSGWSIGATADYEAAGSNPQYPGVMTRGVLSPFTYYYRRLFTDAVRAVEAAASHPMVDPDRIAVTGTSQGGGVTLAVSGLLPDKVKLVMPDVPFLCDFKRATRITDATPYQEIVIFCKNHRDKVETVFETLRYFDAMQFAVRAQARALFSVAMMDNVCPPSTVYAAYNYYAGEKDIKTWEYNNHEGGQFFQLQEKINLAAAYL